MLESNPVGRRFWEELGFNSLYKHEAKYVDAGRKKHGIER